MMSDNRVDKLENKTSFFITAFHAIKFILSGVIFLVSLIIATPLFLIVWAKNLFFGFIFWLAIYSICGIVFHVVTDRPIVYDDWMIVGWHTDIAMYSVLILSLISSFQRTLSSVRGN